jgi:periodic tryptophan protein 2
VLLLMLHLCCQVWRTPGLVKEFAPFQLHRTYGGCHDSTTCVDWSADSRWLVAGSKDLTVRVWSREPVEGYRPPTLAGHRESVVAVFFAEGGPHADDPQCTASRAPSTVYTLSRDGALFHWQQLEASCTIRIPAPFPHC